MQSLSLLLQKVKKYYFSLPKQIFCPALGENIHITRIGWEHIINKKSRNNQEIYLRLRHIQKGFKLLKNIKFYQNSRMYIFKKHRCKTWSLVGVVDSQRVEIVIRQTDNNPKHFYSFVYKGNVPKIINKRNEIAVLPRNQCRNSGL